MIESKYGKLSEIGRREAWLRKNMRGTRVEYAANMHGRVCLRSRVGWFAYLRSLLSARAKLRL